MKEFAGRTAVVTGGGSGRGRELVRLRVAEACNVAMCDVSPTGLAEAQRRDAGIPCLAPRLVNRLVLVAKPVIYCPSCIEKRTEVVIERLERLRQPTVTKNPTLLLGHFVEKESRLC